MTRTHQAVHYATALGYIPMAEAHCKGKLRSMRLRSKGDLRQCRLHGTHAVLSEYIQVRTPGSDIRRLSWLKNLPRVDQQDQDCQALLGTCVSSPHKLRVTPTASRSLVHYTNRNVRRSNNPNYASSCEWAMSNSVEE